MMKYKIGKIAQMLGVSIETVRNYERMGLIKPERQDDNAYRLYNAIDLNILRRARAYSSFGLSMKRSVDLLLNGTVADFAAALGECDEALLEKIDFNMQLLMLTRQRRSHLNRIASMNGETVIENSPAMYGICYREGLTFISDEAVQKKLQEWNAIRPFTEALLYYDNTYFDTGKYKYFHGLCIEEPYAAFFGIKADGVVRYFPSQKCLYTFTSCEFEPTAIQGSVMHNAKRILNEREMTASGNIFSRVVHTSKYSGAYRHYLELWIPIA